VHFLTHTEQSLAKFTRKRDPRYKAFLAYQAKLNRSENSAVLKVAKPPYRAQNVEYVEQDWQKISDDLPDNLEWPASNTADSEEWECVACGKNFKSEAAWNSHERSKKHLRELERLRKEMHHDDEELGLQQDHDSDDSRIAEVVNLISNPSTIGENSPPLSASVDDTHTDGSIAGSSAGSTCTSSKVASAHPISFTQVESIDTSIPPVLFQAGRAIDQDEESPLQATSAAHQTKSDMTKREKRRARAAKKIQERSPQQVRHCFLSEEITNNAPAGQTCNSCAQRFESKTKLFKHINATGHALALSDEGTSGPVRKGVKGKK
jgi:DnaJ family protein A protein 5